MIFSIFPRPYIKWLLDSEARLVNILASYKHGRQFYADYVYIIDVIFNRCKYFECKEFCDGTKQVQTMLKLSKVFFVFAKCFVDLLFQICSSCHSSVVKTLSVFFSIYEMPIWRRAYTLHIFTFRKRFLMTVFIGYNTGLHRIR